MQRGKNQCDTDLAEYGTGTLLSWYHLLRVSNIGTFSE